MKKFSFFVTKFMTKKWWKKKKAHISHIEIPSFFLPFSSSKIEMFGWHTVRIKKERRKCNKKVIFCTAFLYTECLIRTIILLLIFFSALIGLLKASKMEFSVVWYGRWWKGEQRVLKVFFCRKEGREKGKLIRNEGGDIRGEMNGCIGIIKNMWKII